MRAGSSGSRRFGSTGRPGRSSRRRRRGSSSSRSNPVAVDRVVDVGPARSPLLRPIPPTVKRSPAITASRRPGSTRATASDSPPQAATSWPVVGGEDGGEVHRPERPRLAPVAGAGGPPVAGEDPNPSVPPGASPRRLRFAQLLGSGQFLRTHFSKLPSLEDLRRDVYPIEMIAPALRTNRNVRNTSRSWFKVSRFLRRRCLDPRHPPESGRSDLRAPSRE